MTQSQKKEEEWPWKDKLGDYSLVPIPKEKQRSLMSVFVVYTGVLACIAVLWAGGDLGAHFNLHDMFVVAIIGSAILALIGGLTAYIGGVTKCSTYVNIRPPFGRAGSWIWNIIISGIPAGIGWFAVETWLFGIMMHSLAPDALWASVGVAALWGGLLMMTTAIVGYRGLAFLSYLVVPMFILLAGVSFMLGIYEGGGLTPLLTITPPEPLSISWGVTLVVGMYIVGAVITADVGRYCEKPRDAPVGWVVQIMTLQVFFLLGAGALTLAMGEPLITKALLAGGIGLGAYMMAVFGQWTTNDNNLYSGSLSYVTFLPVKRSIVTLIEGLIGTGIAASIGFVAGASLAPFEVFLGILGRFLPAVGGVLIADFYVFQWYKGIPIKERYKLKPGMKLAEINLAGWIAALAGGIGGGWLIKVGIPALNSLIIGFAIYLIISIMSDKMKIPTSLGEHILTEAGE
jgi:cytosine permease